MEESDASSDDTEEVSCYICVNSLHEFFVHYLVFALKKEKS